MKNSSEELLPTGIPVWQLIGCQLVYEAPQAAPGVGMAYVNGSCSGYHEQRVEELEAAKSNMLMDFALGQQATEWITIEILKQLIRENPDKMGQVARAWMAGKSQEGDAV